jgi:S1-C subfamily serine protease
MYASFRQIFGFWRKTMQSAIRMILVFLLSCVIAQPAWAGSDVKNAVVKIYTVNNGYDYYSPWQKFGQTSSSGSGCIISGKRILTNAHVVANQTFIQVRRAGEAKKYTAELEAVAHECDIAILRVKNDSFFSGVTPVAIGNLPEIGDQVAVYGFPKGGDKLSITEGVVSRVEHTKYTHSNANLLACQIDAAINSGNSGGPVINGNKLVGVAFQAVSANDAENIGYMVPTPVIRHFLTDIRDGTYDGIPDLGLSWQKMENLDIRRKYHMADDLTGVLVIKVYPDSPTGGILQREDIILSVDEKSVENDGTIAFRDGERTVFDFIIQNKYINDTVEMKVLRKEKVINAQINLSQSLKCSRLVPLEQYDVPPTYFVFGGIVFQPLTVNFLKLWGDDWYDEANKSLLHYYKNGYPTKERKELVLLAKVLADEINVGYHDLHDRIISYVNGEKIRDMKDLVKALENNKAEYHNILDETGYRIVLDSEKVKNKGQSILEKYGINSDRSKDLEHL